MLLDEAYCEFNLLDDPDASIALLERHPNLVLLRTFSKIYGLCGLRVGYALCGSRELPDALTQVRQPFFCNAAAQAAAVEALAHQDEVARRVERVVDRARRRSRTACARSASSRRRRRPTSAGSISARAATRRRSCAASPRRACSSAPVPRSARTGALRVTYGTPAENARFLQALESVLRGAGES